MYFPGELTIERVRAAVQFLLNERRERHSDDSTAISDTGLADMQCEVKPVVSCLKIYLEENNRRLLY